MVCLLWRSSGLAGVDSGPSSAMAGGSNRRITGLATQFQLTGPAASSALLKTAADPSGRIVIGTLNNCSGGMTPWGTVLSGEENFNQYFVGADAAPAAAKPRLARYGIPTDVRYPSGSRKRDRADARFDLAVNPERGQPVRLGSRGRPVQPELEAP